MGVGGSIYFLSNIEHAYIPLKDGSQVSDCTRPYQADNWNNIKSCTKSNGFIPVFIWSEAISLYRTIVVIDILDSWFDKFN